LQRKSGLTGRIAACQPNEFHGFMERHVDALQRYSEEHPKTTEIELAWEVKEVLEDAKKEQEAHSIARKGRRAETKVRLSFPETGSVKYTDPWERLARENCNWDHNKIADAFRSFCSQKGIKLGAKDIEKMFVNFCKIQNRI
jgi:hypothetical protein